MNPLPNSRIALGIAVLAGLAGTAAAQCTLDKILANDRQNSDSFGSAVAVSSNGQNPLAAIGAPNDDTPQGLDGGSVYMFQWTSGTWSQLTKVNASDTSSLDYFGTSVAYADPYLIVGAPGNFGVSDSGAAYIFEHIGSQWIQKAKTLPAGLVGGDDVGRSVGITESNGGWAIIGAPKHDWDGNPAPRYQNPDSGAAYSYNRSADRTRS